jgi:hypothetical protein
LSGKFWIVSLKFEPFITLCAKVFAFSVGYSPRERLRLPRGNTAGAVDANGVATVGRKNTGVGGASSSKTVTPEKPASDGETDENSNLINRNRSTSPKSGNSSNHNTNKSGNYGGLQANNNHTQIRTRLDLRVVVGLLATGVVTWESLVLEKRRVDALEDSSAGDDETSQDAQSAGESEGIQMGSGSRSGSKTRASRGSENGIESDIENTRNTKPTGNSEDADGGGKLRSSDETVLTVTPAGKVTRVLWMCGMCCSVLRVAECCTLEAGMDWDLYACVCTN